MKIGLKLYSTDTALISEARDLKESRGFDYIELYIIPGSYEETMNTWKHLDSPFVIHAPHSFHDVNLAQAEKRETNLVHFRETQKFADALDSDIIIVHGGSNGSFDETINQIGMLDDERIALENKPRVGINGEVCVGWSPKEFHLAVDKGVVSQTVLDFGHALYASNSEGIDSMTFIKEFLVFNPKVFHLSDGNDSSEKDMHLNLGEGNLDVTSFLEVIPSDSYITLETPRDPSRGLEDFKKDVEALMVLINPASKHTT